MNVKCPYCGCSYDLGSDVLKQPIGDERLGYGWWLRCFKCKKKWWLKNTAVEIRLNTPIKADKLTKIKKISELSKKHSEKEIKNGRNSLIYIIYAILISCTILCYQYRAIFFDFLINKAQNLSENIKGKVALTDVRYDISTGNMITITGNVINYDESMVSKVNGVKISIYDADKLILTWNNEFEEFKILPQQKVPFAVTKQLTQDIKEIKVEVSFY